MAKRRHHVVERGRSGFGSLFGQRPHHVLKRRGQGFILIDGRVEKELSGGLEVMLFLQRFEEAFRGTKIRNCSYITLARPGGGRDGDDS